MVKNFFRCVKKKSRKWIFTEETAFDADIDRKDIKPWPIIEADLLEALFKAELIENEDQGKEILKQAFWKFAMLDDEFVDFHDRYWVVDHQARRIAEIMSVDREHHTLSSTEKERYDLVKSVVYPPLLKHYGPRETPHKDHLDNL